VDLGWQAEGRRRSRRFELTSTTATTAHLAAVAPGAVRSLRWLTVALLAALAIRQLRAQPIARAELVRRLPRCVAGLGMFGVGIVLFFEARLGTAPWDVFHGGLARRVGLPVGLVINLVGLAVLPLWVPLGERIGLGTVLNTVLIGVTVDLFRPIIPAPEVILVRLVFVACAVALIGSGSALYIGSGLGAGPRDGVMMGLARFGLSVRAGRTLIEATTLLAGLALGGTAGLGTVVFLVAIGPSVQALLPRLGLPPLARRA
jgi:uncharacterized membrane protein YczE